MTRAYRYELNPNNRQRSSLHRHAGVARFAYNWGLEQRMNLFRNNQGGNRFTDAMRQHRLLNSLKSTQFPWMYQVSKCASQEALRDLHRAFQNFYRGLKTGQRVGSPRFKRKGVNDSFRLTGTINLVAVSLPETENAFGEDVSLSPDSLSLERATSMKQEPNSSP